MKIVLIVGLIFSGLSFGQTADEGSRTNCNVNVWSGMPYQGNRCPFFDQVMTGIEKLDPLTIRCSRMSINCFRGKERVEATLENVESSEKVSE
jgi:hypothetical protein